METCVNCQSELTGKFCNECGQRAQVKRITLKEGWNDFWARIYGFDGMFPRTLRDLTLNPGIVTQRFMAGNRVRYYGPVGYFFFIITLMYLVASLLGIDVFDFFKSIGNDMNVVTQQTPKEGSGQEKFMEYLMRTISDNMKLMSFVMVPIQAFSSRFIFFRKSELNFVEHMILPLYTQGHIYWLSIMSIIYYFFSGSFISGFIQTLVSVIYTSYAYSTLFTYQSRVKAFFKGLGIYLTTQLIFMVVMFIIIIILVLINPDIMEMIRPSNNR